MRDRASRITIGFLVVLAILPALIQQGAFLGLNSIAGNGLTLHGNWTLGEEGSQSTVELPSDFGNLREKGVPKTWTLRKEFKVPSKFDHEQPALLLGRIGDVDEVLLNGKRVGKTGKFFEEGKHGEWARSYFRLYPFSNELLRDGSNVLVARVQKIGSKGSGIYAGPLAIVDGGAIHPWVRTLNFLETEFLAALSMVILSASLFFFLIFVLLKQGKQYFYFSLTAAGVFLFDLSVSRVLYRVSDNLTLLMGLNAFAAMFSSTMLLFLLRETFSILHRIFVATFGAISAAFFLTLFFQDSLDAIYDVYVNWIQIFFVTFLLVSVEGIRKKVWKTDLLGAIAFFLLSSSVLHDVAVELGVLSFPYLLPYGFAVFTIFFAFSLAVQFSKAFLHVEAQVAARTRDLGQAIEQLRSMDQMKQRFFANVSHDLKTPIAVALGAIEDAKDQAGVVLAPAKRSLNKLLGMIQTILDTVKAESGSLSLQWKLTPVTDTISQWMQPFQTLGIRKGVNMELNTYGYQGLKVPMDPEKFQRVFDNLLSNAIKFTEKGTVRVTLRTDAARMYLDIEDSGIGIPEEERGHVFERFFQSTRTNLKQHGGSGIGLSFVKEMVEIHNGEIWVEESEFGGSKFIVSLPLSQDVEIMGEYQLVDDDEERGELLKGSLDVTYPPERPKDAVEGLPKILCAEDNPEVAQIVVSALSSHFNVHFASNGERALERLESEVFDGLVSDIVMPRMRGDELVQKVRTIAKLRDLPIVMLSSHGEEKMIVDLLGSGANDYVTKPFRREILLARVSSQIQAHRTSRWISKNEKVIELGFLAGGMAHQIRNGLNSLQNHLSYQRKILHRLMDEAMNEDDEDDQKIREKISRTESFVEKALLRIERLTDSVRSYTTGSRKRTQIKLADSVDLAIALHEDRMNKNGIKVHREGLQGKSFEGYSAFHEVFVNLIGNGIDACLGKGDGKIEITANELKDGWEIRVRDNGKGIPPDVLPNLCQPFFTTKDPDSGTGLGLYMVRDIVEAQHGGELEIQSEGEGKGATFIVRVPKTAPDTVRDSHVLIHNVAVG